MRKILSSILFYINIFAGIALFLSYLSTHISPARIWILAFFGLAYPYILIVNLIFVVFYIIKRNRKFLFSFIIILLGIDHLNAFIPVRPGRIFKKSGEVKTVNQIKILSFNVRAFNIYEWYSDPHISKSILNLVRSERPDIICLQEYYAGSHPDHKSEDILKLFSNTPFHFIHQSNQDPYSGYGIATFSKYPIINKGSISFPRTVNKSIYIDVNLNHDTVRIYNNHLQSVSFHRRNLAFLDTLKFNYDEKDFREIKDISLKLRKAYVIRSRQVDSISCHIRKCPYPVLVCGDFNDTPVSYAYNKMTTGLHDAFISAGKGIGNTYYGLFPSLRIDYILHSEEFNPRIFDRIKIKLSDHYPIMCTFDLKKQE